MNKEQYLDKLKIAYSSNSYEKNEVDGVFDAHNEWQDSKIYLFKGIDTKEAVALDFGTGAGRNIVLFQDIFKRIDGADVADMILNKAKAWLQKNNIAEPTLYLIDGTTLKGIPSEAYDVIFSTIVLQHICSYLARREIFQNMLRVLRPGGYICHQMGFGGKTTPSVKYFNEPGEYLQDVTIKDPEVLQKDLLEIGFQNFSYDIRPTGPFDSHLNWIYFRAQKPK
jgi:ubiquinone/menaquinone biosynthesis C-methylase UbiE